MDFDRASEGLKVLPTKAASPSRYVSQMAQSVLRPFKEWRTEGVIKAVSADLDPQKRTAHLWIEVINSDGRLNPQILSGVHERLAPCHVVEHSVCNLMCKCEHTFRQGERLEILRRPR